MDAEAELLVLEKQVATLRTEFGELAAELGALASAFADDAPQPEADLVDRLDGVRAEFRDVRARLLALAASTEVAEVPPAESLVTVRQLERLLEVLSQAVARDVAVRARTSATAILRRVLGLRHVDRLDFEPLSACQAQAETLLEQVSALESLELPGELKRLSAADHPFANLVELTDDQADLDDARWEVLRAAVAGAFGVDLAVAAARGRLRVADLPRPDVRSEPTGDEEDQLATLTLHLPAASDLAPLLPPARDLPSQVAPQPAPGRATERALWDALAGGMPALGYQLGLRAPDLAASAGLPTWLLRALSLSP